jgi:hypothetical protein
MNERRANRPALFNLSRDAEELIGRDLERTGFAGRAGRGLRIRGRRGGCEPKDRMFRGCRSYASE